MLGCRSTLVLARHADDETLGAGGTLLRLRNQGSSIHWGLMTIPVGAGYSQGYIDTHEEQVQAVNTAFGFETMQRLSYPASSLADQPFGAIVDRLRKIAADLRPEVVLIPHSGDAHDDHGITARAAWAAFKSFRMTELGVRSLYAMEILSETGASVAGHVDPFRPTTIVDISAYAERKIEIFSLYRSEITQTGPRSLGALRAQSTLHGGEYGFGAAERFSCLQHIEPD